MATCPRFPEGKVREIIERTAETGKEHAVIMCDDGSITDVVEGDYNKANIQQALTECDLSGEGDNVDVIHTHPNGSKSLSDPDRKVAASEGVRSVCVAVEGGDVVCEMVDRCETEYNV